MASIDIFNDDAFSMVQLTSALQKVPYVPDFLGTLNIFEPKPVQTTKIVVEKQDNILKLIPTSSRGAPLEQFDHTKRDIRDFETVRIAKGDTLYASEIQNIRAFGSESELAQVQQVVLERMTRIRNDVELTHEHMRLGAVQGIVLDADGSEIINWYSGWGIAQPTEIDFALDTDTTNIRTKCQEVIRAMKRAAKGAWTQQTMVHALCGDTFFDKLIDHPNVRASFQNWSAAQELKENKAHESFPYGGIVFHNYRGADDFDDSATEGTEMVGIPSAKAKFFPVGAREVFQVAYSPGESFDLANQPGQPVYGMIIPDNARNQWVKVEEYSYPLHICTRPEMLQRAKAA